MNIISSESRTVKTKSGPLVFTLERKQIKNINLRIRHDGQIYVSASPNTPIKLIDDFVSAKHEYIINAVNGFKQIEQKSLRYEICQRRKCYSVGKESSTQYS